MAQKRYVTHAKGLPCTISTLCHNDFAHPDHIRTINKHKEPRDAFDARSSYQTSRCRAFVADSHDLPRKSVSNPSYLISGMLHVCVCLSHATHYIVKIVHYEGDPKLTSLLAVLCNHASQSFFVHSIYSLHLLPSFQYMEGGDAHSVKCLW